MNPRLLTVATVASCVTLVVLAERTVARFASPRQASSDVTTPLSIAGLGPVSRAVDSRFVQELQAIAMGTAPRSEANKAPVTEQADAGNMTVASLEQGRP